MQTVTSSSSPDRPEEDRKARYAAGFFCAFFAGDEGLCGAGGVASIRRNTSSSLGDGGGCFGLLIGELL
jgi:hypothetical protein